MPSLVEKTAEGKQGGIWEVKWTWMPAFIAMDRQLVARVDDRLNQLYAGGDPPLPEALNRTVIREICRSYPMFGLRETLESIIRIDPTIKIHLVDSVDAESKEEVSTRS